MEERWDIYDKNKQPTGRTMKRNDWTLKDDEYLYLPTKVHNFTEKYVSKIYKNI